MSLEQNKNDFENALESLSAIMESLEDIIIPDILNVLDKVVTEYNGHYKSNIEDLIVERDELEDEVSSLQNEVQDLEADVSNLEGENSLLEDEVRNLEDEIRDLEAGENI